MARKSKDAATAGAAAEEEQPRPARAKRVRAAAAKKPPVRDDDSEDEGPAGKKQKAAAGSSGGSVEIYAKRQPLPVRNAHGELVFKDYPNFRPNLTPKEVLQLGSFGGTYFRPIYSGVKGESRSGQWKELPKDWLEGLNVGRQVASRSYDVGVNKYGVKCGGSLEMWESSGWITDSDPYGWFQWYCRFYQGRRCSDDERQISRGLKCFGPTGRWRSSLITKVARAGTDYDNEGVSPVVRQTLQVRYQ